MNAVRAYTIHQEKREIPQDIISQAKRLGIIKGKNQKLSISDDNILMISSVERTNLPLHYTSANWLYYGPDKDSKRFVYESCYGYGTNVRDIADSLEELLPPKELEIINSLRNEGFTICGVEYDQTSVDVNLVLDELEYEDREGRRNLTATKEEIRESLTDRNKPLTIWQYINFAKDNGLIDEKEYRLLASENGDLEKLFDRIRHIQKQ